ncbi:hypothetical protein VTJ49DRAFT_6183 [Mycothermus thermophilus]|uniref:MARVEL domain-containing protein n=1 Tax=Humicola insolens TaxID=85995 RepID=A0ABR3VJV4_HUMIN
MQKIQLALRATQLLFIIILTGLIGNVIASNINAASSATAAINFTMFVIVVSWLCTLLGLVAALIDRVSLPVLALLGADAFATLFTFIAAVVLSAKLGAVNCGNTKGRSASWIAYGSANDTKRCREVQASAAFMWFLFATFTAAMTLGFLGFRKGGGSLRSSIPTMSQVRV